MNKLKDFIKKVIVKGRKKLPLKRDRIILIPPAILNGSFGDDLMVKAFCDKFPKNEITIFSEKTVKKEYLNNRIKYRSWSESLKIYKYDFLIILGADNLTGAYGIKTPLYKLEFLSKAEKYNLATSIISFSWKEVIPSEIKYKLLSLRKTSMFVRDPNSFRKLYKLKPVYNLFQSADIGLLTTSNYSVKSDFESWFKAQKDLGRRIFALCPNAIQANEVGLELYMKYLGELVSSLDRTNNLSCIFMYHDLRPQTFNSYSDKEISCQIFKTVNSTSSYFVEGLTNGPMLKPYLKDVDFIISGRMHFGISGYSNCVPMFGIGYEEKFRGLQELFGLNPDDTVVDISNLEGLHEKVINFVNKLEHYRRIVIDNHFNVRKLAESNFNLKIKN